MAFEFHSCPYIPGTRAVYFGWTQARDFIPNGDGQIEKIEEALEGLLDRMQADAEKIGGNAIVSFELVVDREIEQDGVPGVQLSAGGTATRLDPW